MALVISPQLESRLVNEAKIYGLTPDAYAELLLSRVLSVQNELRQEESETKRVEISENQPIFGSARGMVLMRDDFDAPLF